MKVILLILLFYFSFLGCKNVNKDINLCESYIINNLDYSTALKEYINIFIDSYDNNKYVSTRHINNALICSIKSKDTLLTFILTEELRKRGATEEYFIGILKGFKINNLSDSLGETKINFKDILNHELRNKLDSMYELDQKYRLYGNSDSISIADSVNLVDLKQIFQEYGYPKEELVGSWFGEKYLVSNRIDIIILHQLQQNNRELAAEIYQMYLKNEIDQFSFSSYYTYGFSMGVPGYNNGFMFCSKYSFPLIYFNEDLHAVICRNEITNINKLRSAYSMDNYNLMIKKCSFRGCEGFYFYEPQSYVVTMEKEFLDMIKGPNDTLINLNCKL